MHPASESTLLVLLNRLGTHVSELQLAEDVLRGLAPKNRNFVKNHANTIMKAKALNQESTGVWSRSERRVQRERRSHDQRKKLWKAAIFHGLWGWCTSRGRLQSYKWKIKSLNSSLPYLLQGDWESFRPFFNKWLVTRKKERDWLIWISGKPFCEIFLILEFEWIWFTSSQLYRVFELIDQVNFYFR